MRPEMVTTERGFLKIQTDKQRYRGTAYSSGQVMSWNKFCMSGGLVEVRFVLPGQPGVEGLWPAIWMLGNLGRATFEVSEKRARARERERVASASESNAHVGRVRA
jgi:beta-glucanase (GH16 family)